MTKTTCDRCSGSLAAEDEVDETTPDSSGCVITSVKSDTLDVSGGCPDSGEIQIELKEEEEIEPVVCEEVENLFPTDFIEVKRGDKCIKISIDNLMKQLGCKECL